MLLVILYFVLNFAGFLAFLAIWNRLPKPKPFDYTTIPGMKLNVSTAEEIPELVAMPGEKVDFEFKGNFEEIKKLKLPGSYLHGHPKYCTSIKLASLKTSSGSQQIHVDQNLSEDVQNRLLVTLEDVNSEEDVRCDVPQILENLKQCKVQLKKTRKSLSRPLLVVFDTEIWVDAHPIPKFIPIIIHTSEIIKAWSDDELFPKYYAQLYWLPGFSMITEIS
ncbi:Protein CBG15728 [Caenorhabditis briggsae]|uniref:Protein CBG15728 n=1 Tax=Caenorhabditis briggsae TaxID=6238 RepID=A8XMM7_CAEBR|nr:Protein CBG15728 [Caenorhabditis briggsae]CAP33903.2 Protein CBG15728 [Caenorhabditis briggsae]